MLYHVACFDEAKLALGGIQWCLFCLVFGVAPISLVDYRYCW